RQAVGTLPGTHQVVGTGLGGRIRRAGRVRRGFGEQIVRSLQIAIYLVSGYMVETESRFGGRLQPVPVAPGSLKQDIGADDIGLNKVRRPIDGSVHMGLGRQVHYRCRLKLPEDFIQLLGPTDIYTIKTITWRIITPP